MNGGLAGASAGIETSPSMGPAQGEATTAEGIVLIMACWCAVLATGLLAPILPQIAAAFENRNDIELMVGLVATVPALMVAMLAVPFGRLADRAGQRRVLLAGLLLYGAAGIAPFWLLDLNTIIAARVVVGIGEAAVMTASTALISLRFSGARRARWLGAQVAAANTLGVLVLLLGGQLGLLDWRVPFLAYSFGLFLLILTLAVVRQPAKTDTVLAGSSASPPAAGMAKHAIIFCGLNTVAILALFVIIVQMSFLMPQRGAMDSADIAVAIAIGAAGVAFGNAFAGSVARRLGWWLCVAAGFLTAGIGYILLAVASTYWLSSLLALLSGLGIGLITPTLLSTLVTGIPARHMGTIIGVWTSATFIAQFLNPPLFVGLQGFLPSRDVAIGAMGVVCVLMGLGVALLGRGYRLQNVNPD